jgi:hypothetical protein
MASVMRFDQWQDSNGVPVASGAGGNLSPVNGYLFKQTLYFFSNGTFAKASYPWLRAIRVRVQGAGGGGGGSATTGSSQFAAGGGGGGGAYAEAFITNIAGLDSSVTVTRGAGGTGGAINGTGGSGGASSFGALVSANGGGPGTPGEGAGTAALAFGNSGAGSSTTSGADFAVSGSFGTPGFVRASNRGYRGHGGQSFLSTPTNQQLVGSSFPGDTGSLYGGGGGGAVTPTSSTTGNVGGAGGNGIVIVELYA